MNSTAAFEGTRFEMVQLFVGHKLLLLNLFLPTFLYSRKRSIEKRSLKKNGRLLQSRYDQGITEGVAIQFKVTMKTAISLPDSVFAEAEALAKELGLSRSELYAKALQAYLQKYNQNQILNKLNQVYSEESSELDPTLARLQLMSLPHEDW